MKFDTLHPANDCYWWQDAPPKPAPAAKWEMATEIAIIGAGYTGLAAAIKLARAGRQVAVVEKGLLGEGASARNGGITSGHIRFSTAELNAKFGKAHAQAIEAEAVKARAGLAAFIAEEKLQCDHRASGRVTGLYGPFSRAKIETEIAEFERAHCIARQFLDRAAMEEHIKSEYYGAGILHPDIGSIHPAKMLHEMARVALEAGVKIFSETAALHVRRQGGDFTLSTEAGNLKAEHLIWASNAYTDGANPWLRRRLVPVISEIITTEDLGKARVKAFMPKLNMFSESKRIGHYYRPTPDGKRILFGGRRMHNDNAQAKKRLKSALVEIFPELADVSVEHYWSGFVAYPFDQLPKLTVHNGIIYPTGYCGSGTVWALRVGQMAAAMILGEEVKTGFSDQKLRTRPFYSGKPWFLPLAMAYYRLRDRIDGQG